MIDYCFTYGIIIINHSSFLLFLIFYVANDLLRMSVGVFRGSA